MNATVDSIRSFLILLGFVALIICMAVIIFIALSIVKNVNSVKAFAGELAKGDFTVDAATKAQAEADIAKDGYWGVNQTTERILDFAKALAGDDPDKLESMREAFEKGYKQAEKTWGGELPDISKQTFDAVMKGFDELTGKVSTE